MTARPIPSLLALLLAPLLALCACVDETGYECPDGQVLSTGDVCVDETGYLVPDLLLYTAPAPLDDGPRPVTLLGRPGALPGAGSLTIEGPEGDPATAIGPDEDGAFRAEVSAAAGDELLFRFTPEGGAEGVDGFVLEDALTDVAPPENTSSQPLLSAPVDGVVTVSLSAVQSTAPPFVVFNDSAADPAFVVADEAVDVELAAASGDLLCLFALADDAASTRLCQTVP